MNYTFGVIVSLFKLLGGIYNKTIHHLFPNGPFLQKTNFVLTQQLESAFPEIKMEYFKAVNKSGLQSMEKIFVEQKSLLKEDSWKLYMLKSFSFIHLNKLEDLPTCMKILQNKKISSAFFSVIDPMKEIAPHKGPFKGVIRIFLPLIVPKDRDNCFIVVGGKKRYFEEGQCLVFDDYYEHYVVNNTNEARVVLFIDYVRPLPFPFKFINNIALKAISNSSFIKKVRLNTEKN